MPTPDAPTPDPELADRLEEARALSMLCGATGTAISHADAKAAAVRLREQDAEITRLRRICEPLDGNILQARLDKLDRIEAALGDEIPADLRYYARVRTSRGSNLLRRLADALGDTDG